MKQLIDEKKRGAANLEMRLEELLANIAKATQETAEASKKAAERSIITQFGKDSVRFEAGSTMNGNVIQR